MSILDLFLPPNVRLLRAAKTGDLFNLEKAISQKADLQMMSRRGETALGIAYTRGHREAVRILLENGAEPEDRLGLAMFFKEAEKGNLDILQLLLAHGVNINHANKAGTTALMLAALNGKYKTVEYLLQKGANVNASTLEGNTALMAAAGIGHEDEVKILLEHGADLNAVNRDGITAYKAAEKMGHGHICELLITAGAEP